MSLIFIHKWNPSDTDGEIDKKIKSIGTINGHHVYACKNLTTWFRLGDYIIKHDFANYLLGVTKRIANERLRQNVRYSHYVSSSNTFVELNCVNDIVRIVNDQFGENFDYVKMLQSLQDELKGYEGCFYLSQCYGLDFDMYEFLGNKDAYYLRVRWRSRMCRLYWKVELFFDKIKAIWKRN